MKQKKLKNLLIVGSVIIVAVLTITLLWVNNKPKVNGELAVYEIDGTKISATEYYEFLLDKSNAGFLYTYLEREYLSSLPVDEELKSEAKLQKEQTLKDYSEKESKEMLESTLKQLGYKGIDDLQLFFENSGKLNDIVLKNASDAFTKYEPFSILYKPRVVSHVLVAVEKGQEATSEQKALMAQIDQALKENNDFRATTQALADSQRIIAEDLGYVDKDTNLVTEFLEVALNTSENTVSDWVRSEFGYHRIYVATTKMKDISTYDAFLNQILAYDQSLQPRIMLAEMQKANVEINERLKSAIEDYYGIEKGAQQ